MSLVRSSSSMRSLKLSRGILISPGWFPRHIPPRGIYVAEADEHSLPYRGNIRSSVNVASTYIFLFIAFGEIMNKCGMGQFFNDFANAIAGGTKGGPAKVAVVASGLLGMINGAAVAVVVTTGSFTIPLMKKSGYDDEFAGALLRPVLSADS